MPYNKETGFTLFELLVSIAIMVIIVMIALPHFNNLMAQREANNIKLTIQNHNAFARAQATIYHSNIVICPSIDFKLCQPNNWNSGLIIFIDSNKNRQVDANEKILLQDKLNLKYGDLSWRGTLHIPSLTFQASSGLPNGSNGSFYYCSKSRLQPIRAVLSRMGHFRFENPASC